MNAFLTYTQAVTLYGGLVTTGITIEEAIIEVVRRAYESGRWSEMTASVPLDAAWFSVDSDNDCVYLDVDPNAYNGAIGFRGKSGGWSVVGEEDLFSPGGRRGDDAFVDFGIVTVGEDEKRRFRLPLSFQSVPTDSLWGLFKLHPPTLEFGTTVPIATHALRAGIKAVCYEVVDADDDAEKQWAKFERAMALSHKQYGGVKRRHIGFNGMTRRRPTNFM